MKNTKGVELPINALVILILAIVVLAAAIAIFTGIYVPGKDTTTDIGAFSGACSRFAAAGCCSTTNPAPEETCDPLQTSLETTAENSDIPRAAAVNTCCRQRSGG